MNWLKTVIDGFFINIGWWWLDRQHSRKKATK